MSENIDINVGIIKEEISINAANNIVEVNISTAPVTIINPQNYDLSQFTNTSPNPFIQQSTLSSYVPISRIITINGVAQDLSTNRSWTIPGATWGSITGTLAAQTDLQAALNARVPYTGATSNVNLGEYGLTTGQLTLDTSPTGTAVVGTTRWNDSIGSSETTLKGGSVILKNGVDLVARVVNKVTPNATLTKANYTAVRISGAQGQRLAVAYAQANNDANSADTIGLVTETIPTNQEGFIITVGNLEGINTTGALQGETWADGDVLYLSPTIPGAITNIKPTGLTGHIVVIGYVEYAHAINGKIYVKIMNGWELDELHNVYINPATLANNNILQYDSADQLWKNKVLSTGITIGSTAIASGVVGRVLFEGAGNVVQESSSLFWDATNNRLGIGTSTPFWGLHYNVDGGLNVGMFSSYGTTSTFESLLYLFRSRGTSSAPSAVLSGDNLGSLRFAGQWGSSLNEYTTGAKIEAVATQNFSSSVNSARMSFYTTADGSNAIRENMRLFSSGNLLLQNGGTFTDAGFRLDVNGNSRVRGAGATGSTNAFTVQNSASSSALSITNGLTTIVHGDLQLENTVLYWSSGSQIRNISNGVLRITNSSNSDFTRLQFGGGTTSFPSLQRSGSALAVMDATGTALTNLLVGTTTDAGFRLDVNGTAIVRGILTINDNVQGKISADNQYLNLYHNGGTQSILSFGFGSSIGASGYLRINQNAGDPAGTTSGTIHRYDFNSTITNSTGTAQWNFQSLRPNYNFTGTYAGIVRGFYYNPTLTSMTGVTHRAIETTTGDVIFNGGNVGIGTSSPTNTLTIGAAVAASLQSSAATIFTSNENASNVFSQVAASNDPIQRPVFAGLKSRGTLLSPTAVQAGDACTTFLSSAFDGTAGQASAALSFDAESNASSGNAPQLISFITGTSGATRTTKMQVRSNGNVLIGTTTDAGYKLDVNGSFRSTDGLIASSVGGYKLTVQHTGVSQGGTFRVIQLGYTMLDVNTSGVVFMPFPSASGTVGITNWTSTGGQTTTFFTKNSEFTPQGSSQAIPLIKFPNASAPVVMGATATADLRGYLTVSGSFNATSGLGVGQSLLPTLTATANNDTLVGLDINPTFTNGAFTGVENIPLRFVSQSNSNVVKNILLKNIGTGNGTGVSIGFNNLNANNLSHAFIKSYYVVPSGMAMSFGTGGGSSLTSEGTTALVLNADQTANFTGRVIANSGGFQAIGVSANMLMSDGGTPVITRNGGTGIQFLKDAYWQTFSIFTNNTENLRVASTGNILIGTTTDAGFRLDVNGDSRLKGSGSTSVTNALTVQNSAGTNLLAVRNNNTTYIANTVTINAETPGGTGMVISHTAWNNSTGLSVNSAIGIVAWSSLGANSSNPDGASIVALGRVGGDPLRKSVGLRSNRAIISSGFAYDIVDSAMLQVDSTTQGFLPPRMTTTQINAIASPAEGLMVYNTTISHMCVYQAGSWVKLSHSPM